MAVVGGVSEGCHHLLHRVSFFHCAASSLHSAFSTTRLPILSVTPLHVDVENPGDFDVDFLHAWLIFFA
ncbi:hypothetical protein Drorol1_Dr00005376 [Drosera rotundifolia]